jgi:hypothetical protein
MQAEAHLCDAAVMVFACRYHLGSSHLGLRYDAQNHLALFSEKRGILSIRHLMAKALLRALS